MSAKQLLILIVVILVGPAALFALVLPQKSEVTASHGVPGYLHCPECSFEAIYSPTSAGKICPKCGNGRLEPAHQSRKEKSQKPASLGHSPVALGMLTSAGLLVAVHAYLVWKSRRSAKANAPIYQYCKCTKCKRKVRYEAREFARTILCPACRTELKAPATPGLPPAKTALKGPLIP